MAYISPSDIRNRLSLDSFKPSDSVLNDFISKAEEELKALLGGSLTKAVLVEYEKDEIKSLSLSDFKSIIKVLHNGREVKEFSDEELLNNPDLEEVSDSSVDYWNSSAGSGDSLSHDSDNFYTFAHSLKITKGGSEESYWYSDSLSVSDQCYYKASARIKVDSNTSGNTYLKLQFLDEDESPVKTYTSPAVTLEITQPSSATTLSIVSDSSSDDWQTLMIFGVVDGIRKMVSVELNGTSTVTTSEKFSEIISIKKSNSTSGTITVKDSGGSTLASLDSSTEEVNEWIKTEVIGSPPADAYYMRVLFSCSSSSGSAYADHFKLRKQNWFLMGDGIHFTDARSGLFEIIYEKSQVPKQVHELIRDLASLFTLLYLNGADTSGINYAALKNAQFTSLSYRYLFDDIRRAFERNLEKYLAINQAAFLVSEFE